MQPGSSAQRWRRHSDKVRRQGGREGEGEGGRERERERERDATFLETARSCTVR